MSSDNSDEWVAEIYARQAEEWIKECPVSGRCPGNKIFRYLVAQQNKIDRLEHRIKELEEFPLPNGDIKK